MEIIKKSEIKILSNPGVESFQLLNPENSKSERISITRVWFSPIMNNLDINMKLRNKYESPLMEKGLYFLQITKKKYLSDVVRFADGDIHGLKNNSQDIFEYISVTSPPINFGYAYKNKK